MHAFPLKELPLLILLWTMQVSPRTVEGPSASRLCGGRQEVRAGCPGLAGATVVGADLHRRRPLAGEGKVAILMSRW
eukprot:8573388-Alexandrium_andersonii.AAC.1